MALPVTITGISTAAACVGPFKSSGGNYYIVGVDSPGSTRVAVQKATDPTSSFSEVATATVTGTSHDIQQIAAFQVGDLIHIAEHGTVLSSDHVQYCVFDMSSDSFSVSFEAVHSAFDSRTSGSVGAYGVSIVARSDGTVVILYNGPRVAAMGNSYSRIVYARRAAGGGWTTNIAVDAGGTADGTMPEAVLGSSDRTHFHYNFSTGATNRQKALTSGNSLQAEQTVTASASQFWATVSYDDAGTQRVIVIQNSTSGSVVGGYSYNSGDTPTMTARTISSVSPLSTSACVMNDGTDAWALFTKSADSDLYVRKSTDGGATWGSEALAMAASVTSSYQALSVDGNIYQRGSDIVIPYVVNDGGTLKYNEYVVRTVTVDDAEAKVNLQAEHEFSDAPGLDLAIAEPPDDPPPPDVEQITLALDDPEVDVPPGLNLAEARQGDDVFDGQDGIDLALDMPEVEALPGLDLTLDTPTEEPVVDDSELILNLQAEHEVLVEPGLDLVREEIEDHVFGHEAIELAAEHEVIEPPGLDLAQDRPFDDVFDEQDEIGLALDDPEVVEPPGLDLAVEVPTDHVFEVEDFQLLAEHEVVDEPGLDLALARPSDDVFDDAPEIVQLEAFVEIEEIPGVDIWEAVAVIDAPVAPDDNEQIVALIDDVQVEDIPGLDFTVSFPFDFVEADFPEVVQLAAEEPYLDAPGETQTEAMQPDSVFGDGAEIVQLEAEPAPDDLVPDSAVVNLTDEFDAGDPLEFLPGPLDMPIFEDVPGVDLTVLSHSPFDDAPPVVGVTRRPNNPMIYSTGAMMRR